MQHSSLKMSFRAWAKPVREKTQVKKREILKRRVNKKYTQVTKLVLSIGSMYFIRLIRAQPPVVVLLLHHTEHRSVTRCCLFCPLAHPVGRTVSVDQAAVCCRVLCFWDAACVVLFVYSSWWPLSVSQDVLTPETAWRNDTGERKAHHQ